VGGKTRLERERDAKAQAKKEGDSWGIKPMAASDRIALWRGTKTKTKSSLAQQESETWGRSGGGA